MDLLLLELPIHPYLCASWTWAWRMITSTWLIQHMACLLSSSTLPVLQLLLPPPRWTTDKRIQPTQSASTAFPKLSSHLNHLLPLAHLVMELLLPLHIQSPSCWNWKLSCPCPASTFPPSTWGHSSSTCTSLPHTDLAPSPGRPIAIHSFLLISSILLYPHEFLENLS